MGRFFKRIQISVIPAIHKFILIRTLIDCAENSNNISYFSLFSISSPKNEKKKFCYFFCEEHKTINSNCLYLEIGTN